jgi:hypothetical protein
MPRRCSDPGSDQPPPGRSCTGVGETEVRLRDIAGLIGTRLGLPVEAIAADTATGHFGWIGNLVEWMPRRPVSSPASSWTGVLILRASMTWQLVRSSPARRHVGREPLPGFDRPACTITRDIHVGCRRIRAVRTASAAGLVTARFVQHGRTALTLFALVYAGPAALGCRHAGIIRPWMDIKTPYGWP